MGVVSSLKPFNALALIVAVRLASVFLVQTWFVPDEYWQSLEVAHRLVFGYGHLTWEWVHGIRGYLHPALVAGLYKALDLLALDIPELLIVLPRVLQALLSAAADYSLYRWSGRHKWALFLTLTQWFWFYTASRTLTNSAEAALVTIGLAEFPFSSGPPKGSGWLCWAALSCVVRPTAAVLWLPLCAYHVLSAPSRARLLALTYLPIAAAFLALSTALDSYFHGDLIFTPWEFLKLNVLNSVGSFYGEQPWYWYFVIGFPVVLGANLLPLLCSAVEALRDRHSFGTQRLLLLVLLFTLSVYSFLPHKEFRFLLPLVPLVTFITQDTLSRWSRRARGLYVYLVFGALLLGNALPAGYVGLLHQRGPLDAAALLRDIAQRHPANSSFLFLMPCHSAPLYSHLHVNIPTRFLTCEPNLSGRAEYRDEAEQFFEEPGRWLQREYLAQQPGSTPGRSKLPSHVLLFDTLAPRIANFLAYYSPLHTIFHTNFPLEERQGHSVLLFHRNRAPAPHKPATSS